MDRGLAYARWRHLCANCCGFRPGTSSPTDRVTVENAVKAYVAEGARVVWPKVAADDIATVDVDGRLVSIGVFEGKVTAAVVRNYPSED
jgi:hypothetical protein